MEHQIPSVFLNVSMEERTALPSVFVNVSMEERTALLDQILFRIYKLKIIIIVLKVEYLSLVHTTEKLRHRRS